MKFLLLTSTLVIVAALGSAQTSLPMCSGAVCDTPPACDPAYGYCKIPASPSNQYSYCGQPWQCYDDNACNSTSCMTPKCDSQCDKATCEAAVNLPNCSVTQTNFWCSAGIAANGCFRNPPVNRPDCRKCCDLRSCSSYLPNCTVCPANQCFAPTCDPNGPAPYQCTAGSAAGGCGPSSKYWDNVPGCTACCKCPSN
jgi:hypothetical protein